MNRISVNIYDKDYTIVGDQSAEQIAKMGAHVDGVMREIAEAASGAPLSAVAVLSAINIVDELFKAREKNEELQRLNEQYSDDTRHYVQLWEEAKQNYADYKQENKEELETLKREKEVLAVQLQNKAREVESVMRNQKNIEERAIEGSKENLKEAEKRYSDLENSFFDLQMENIQLKSELEKMKSNAEWKKDEQQGY